MLAYLLFTDVFIELQLWKLATKSHLKKVFTAQIQSDFCNISIAGINLQKNTAEEKIWPSFQNWTWKKSGKKRLFES